MKKIFLVIAFCIGFILQNNVAQAASLAEALDDKKPFIMLIYTSWAQYQMIYSNMKYHQPSFKNYNFVKVDLASADASNLFIDKSFAITNIPMVVLVKNGGRITKTITNQCAADEVCLAKTLKHFTH